eukprot:CAMPEP_0119562108 /NCGR_PEP_ID=MMETSP1352-20130426/19533_1 /TAXON_ID=265584 /ORGANISM="Stauroneis constricta, Strain CCMP1120" /LENGTH=692 /DNA_ID=CAMNT_0007610455 /DNA_START=108 /DNA_END=2189 /DNA_ORIENTATION=+
MFINADGSNNANVNQQQHDISSNNANGVEDDADERGSMIDSTTLNAKKPSNTANTVNAASSNNSNSNNHHHQSPINDRDHDSDEDGEDRYAMDITSKHRRQHDSSNKKDFRKKNHSKMKLIVRSKYWGRVLSGRLMRDANNPSQTYHLISAQAFIHKNGPFWGCCPQHGSRVLDLSEEHFLESHPGPWDLYHSNNNVMETSDLDNFFQDFYLIPQNQTAIDVAKHTENGFWLYVGTIDAGKALSDLESLLVPFFFPPDHRHGHVKPETGTKETGPATANHPQIQVRALIHQQLHGHNPVLKRHVHVQIMMKSATDKDMTRKCKREQAAKASAAQLRAQTHPYTHTGSTEAFPMIPSMAELSIADAGVTNGGVNIGAGIGIVATETGGGHGAGAETVLTKKKHGTQPIIESRDTNSTETEGSSHDGTAASIVGANDASAEGPHVRPNNSNSKRQSVPSPSRSYTGIHNPHHQPQINHHHQQQPYNHTTSRAFPFPTEQVGNWYMTPEGAIVSHGWREAEFASKEMHMATSKVDANGLYAPAEMMVPVSWAATPLGQAYTPHQIHGRTPAYGRHPNANPTIMMEDIISIAPPPHHNHHHPGHAFIRSHPTPRYHHHHMTAHPQVVHSHFPYIYSGHHHPMYAPPETIHGGYHHPAYAYAPPVHNNSTAVTTASPTIDESNQTQDDDGGEHDRSG